MNSFVPHFGDIFSYMNFGPLSVLGLNVGLMLKYFS